jgi:hypothetical protein
VAYSDSNHAFYHLFLRQEEPPADPALPIPLAWFYSRLHHHLQSTCILPRSGVFFTPRVVLTVYGVDYVFDHNPDDNKQMESMNDIILPGWVAYIMSTVGFGLVSWLIWLTLATLNNKQGIAINTANDQQVSTKIEELKSDFKEWFVRLETKLDLFIAQEQRYMKNENDYMKQIINENRSR